MTASATPTDAPSALEDRVTSVLGLDVRVAAPELASAFHDATRQLAGHAPDSEMLRRRLSPQWVVLAAGMGKRIDPTGRLNKNLDIWFGGANTLQLACGRLPGAYPPILVISPDMARRFLRPDVSTDQPLTGAIPDDWIDDDARRHYLVEGAQIAVQPVPNGTGGALRAAAALLETLDCDWIGVAFGDEPFLEPGLYAQTLAAHMIAGADATLCGKKPDAVVDKGGLFFDAEGRFAGTKEWYDMSPDEQAWMRQRLAEGRAVTNTGISILSRRESLSRLDRLRPHKDGTELHHVDLFRVFYDDGLRTHVHVYEGDIRSGVNRWENVVVGQSYLLDRDRQDLLRAGVRLAPNARVTFDGSAAEYLAEGRIGVGCYLSGCVHLGRATRVGSYVTLEDTILEGIVDIGTRARLAGVEAHNVTVHGADDPTPLGSPVRLLSALTEIVGCRLTDVVVSSGCSLRDVTAQSTLIPPHARIEGAHLGLRRDPGIGMPYRSVPPVHELVPTTYLPGAFRFGDKKGTFDWDGLCTHVLSMSRAELATRSASHLETRQLFCDCVEELLGARFGSAHLIDSLTPEELWGVIYELSAQVTGTDDPYRIEKLKSRALAADLLEKLKPRSMGWDVLLRVDIAANLIDFTSARVVSRLSENPSYLLEALQAASDATLAIDSRAEFYERLVDGAPQRVLWLTDNDGEVVFDLWIAGRLLDAGHHVTVAARSAPASNDATVSDVRRVMEFPLFLSVRTAEREGRFELIGSGSNTAGTNLFRATPQFMRALLEADVVVSKGQGNWYTLQGIRRDTFFMLMSKGLTAERTTGVIADPAALVDGMVLAFVPEDATWDRPLRDMVADASGA